MNKLEQLIAQLNLVNRILLTRVSLEQNINNVQFVMRVESLNQRVSLAENSVQVKNACSPTSSENR